MDYQSIEIAPYGGLTGEDCWADDAGSVVMRMNVVTRTEFSPLRIHRGGIRIGPAITRELRAYLIGNCRISEIT